MTKTFLTLTLALSQLAPAIAIAGSVEPSSPAQGRAWAALQKEFENVARPRGDKELRKKAIEVLRAIRDWKIDALLDECAMYSAGAKDRRALTKKFFEDHKEAWQTAAQIPDLDAPDFASELQFKSPEPEAGMTGQVMIAFGPKPDRKARKQGNPEDSTYPDRYEIELWWSGPLMPDANGAVYEKAPAGSKPGRWRFFDIVLPHSRTHSMRL